jgi:hypothetical protein
MISLIYAQFKQLDKNMLIEIADRLKTIANSLIDKTSIKPYWVEITTQQPYCVYYFGPFDNPSEAKQMQHGYVEDLMAEKAVGINVEIKRCLPTKLTIMEEGSLVE